MHFSSSSAKLTSCTISNSSAGQVRSHVLEAGSVQEGAAIVRCWGSAGWRCHGFQLVFCKTHLLHDQEQQRWRGKNAMHRNCVQEGAHM